MPAVKGASPKSAIASADAPGALDAGKAGDFAGAQIEGDVTQPLIAQAPHRQHHLADFLRLRRRRVEIADIAAHHGADDGLGSRHVSNRAATSPSLSTVTRSASRVDLAHAVGDVESTALPRSLDPIEVETGPRIPAR